MQAEARQSEGRSRQRGGKPTGAAGREEAMQGEQYAEGRQSPGRSRKRGGRASTRMKKPMRDHDKQTRHTHEHNKNAFSVVRR